MINRANELLERFMRYAAVTTQSEAGAKTVPSTAGQRVLAQMLAEELKALGLSDVEVSEYAVVTGRRVYNIGVSLCNFKVYFAVTVQLNLCKRDYGICFIRYVHAVEVEEITVCAF